MSAIKYRLLYIVLFFVYTQGMWERMLGGNSFLPSLILELSVLAFIFYQFNILKSTPAILLSITIVCYGFIAGGYNGNSPIQTIFYLRYFLYGILIYYQLYSYSLGYHRWYKLLKFSIFMILLQGVGAFYNVFILGERVEGYVGTMSSLGGTTATTFPLFVSSIVLLIYFFKTKTTTRSLGLMILLIVSVFLLGYSCGKRAIYFIIPLFSLIVFFLSMLKIRNSNFFKNKVLGFIIFSILLFPILIFGITNSKGLNYGLDEGESSLEVILNALSYAQEYEITTNQYGETIGRSNTTENILKRMSEDPQLIWVGTGFGTIKNDYSMYLLGVGYGVVGITRDILSAGFIFSLLVILLMLRLILTNHTGTNNLFSSALRILLVLLFFYVHLTYSSDFGVHLKINILLFVILSLINSPVHTESFQKLSNLMEIRN